MPAAGDACPSPPLALSSQAASSAAWLVRVHGKRARKRRVGGGCGLPPAWLAVGLGVASRARRATRRPGTLHLDAGCRSDGGELDSSTRKQAAVAEDPLLPFVSLFACPLLLGDSASSPPALAGAVEEASGSLLRL
ncbi:hypothetical protein GUJ93_ZPchr0002g23263 [Zizania palustris]|uniref:Uncharacterized protein n=1 Tax=Zizania palustris TaxID=103762 RepID=A0A8J5VAA3_ZIZPA|nr:hypothetical protein GUJ93_ZPchr0002g23263 [Zizania palustris]